MTAPGRNSRIIGACRSLPTVLLSHASAVFTNGSHAGGECLKNHFSVASLDASLALAAFDDPQAVGDLLKWEALARMAGIEPAIQAGIARASCPCVFPFPPHPHIAATTQGMGDLACGEFAAAKLERSRLCPAGAGPDIGAARGNRTHPVSLASHIFIQEELSDEKPLSVGLCIPLP